MPYTQYDPAHVNKFKFAISLDMFIKMILTALFLLSATRTFAEESTTRKAPLQDNNGTPIYLTPKAEVSEPTPTEGPLPTPMKVALPIPEEN